MFGQRDATATPENAATPEKTATPDKATPAPYSPAGPSPEGRSSGPGIQGEFAFAPPPDEPAPATHSRSPSRSHSRSPSLGGSPLPGGAPLASLSSALLRRSTGPAASLLANPISANPILANPNLANPNLANPNLASPNLASPNPANPIPAKPTPSRPIPGRPIPARPGTAQQGGSKLRPARQNPYAAPDPANCDGWPAVARPPASRPPASTAPASTAATMPLQDTPEIVGTAKRRIQALLLDAVDPGEAAKLSRGDLEIQLKDLTADLLAAERLTLNRQEQDLLVRLLVDDMVGLGPIEPLLADDSITEIMVNGPKQVYVERNGRIEPSGVSFEDNRQIMNTALRIAARVGRRIDETTAYCDARLEDGSRVNIIVPPLAIDGPIITIRKFARRKFTLERLAASKTLSQAMAAVLMVAGRAGANILISGGTGSGKTTLLNAIAETIDSRERIVTIEDAAELQLQQPHVIRLESRPANLEGKAAVSMRELLINALRMRPDRIILGEVRGSEVIDMLQAMNTGHDGSLSTLHANSPREALMRLENLIAMAGIDLPSKAARIQIASAIDMIVQIARMRDGSRRVTRITEIVGTEGEIITLQDLFVFEHGGIDELGRVRGHCVYTGLQPRLIEKARMHGLDRTLMQALHADEDATAAGVTAQGATAEGATPVGTTPARQRRAA